MYLQSIPILHSKGTPITFFNVNKIKTFNKFNYTLNTVNLTRVL